MLAGDGDVFTAPEAVRTVADIHERILFIEDDPAGRELGIFNLKKAGYGVDAAGDGSKGLAMFDPERHALVITDVRMPEVSGIEVTRGIHERAPDVPILVITAFGNIETAVEAMRAGAEDFVLKPFSREQLLMVVDKALEGRGDQPFGVMEALQDIQEECGYLPEEAMCRVSEVLEVPVIEVFRLANFYKTSSLIPRGRHLITVCTGTACHVQGATRLADEVLSLLDVQPGEMTQDGAFTVETVNCVGACALAPVVIISGKYYDHVTPGKLREILAAVRKQDDEDLANA